VKAVTIGESANATKEERAEALVSANVVSRWLLFIRSETKCFGGYGRNVK
jgi:hypothetical protein